MSDQSFPAPHWVPADPAARAQFESFLRLVFTPPEQMFKLLSGNAAANGNGNGNSEAVGSVPPPAAA